MKRYSGNDLQALYEEAPQELYDRVNRSLAKLPEDMRPLPLISRRLRICLIAVIVTLIGLMTAGFATGTIQRWLYTYEYTVLEDGTAEIRKYNGNDEIVAIPEEIDGYRVTSIGNKAFYQCHFIKEVTIPESVTGIGCQTFSDCTHLASVSIPDSVTIINSYAFAHCHALEEVRIPDSVDIISYGVFSYCSSLRSVRLPEKTVALYRDLFSYCTSLESVEIPGSVTLIDDNVFSFCETLTDIMLPESLTTIGQFAFGHCTSLREIRIPAGVKAIHRYAFLACNNLRLTVTKDSYAAEYCRENSLHYKELPQVKTGQ